MRVCCWGSGEVCALYVWMDWMGVGLLLVGCGLVGGEEGCGVVMREGGFGDDGVYWWRSG